MIEGQKNPIRLFAGDRRSSEGGIRGNKLGMEVSSAYMGQRENTGEECPLKSRKKTSAEGGLWFFVFFFFFECGRGTQPGPDERGRRKIEKSLRLSEVEPLLGWGKRGIKSKDIGTYRRKHDNITTAHSLLDKVEKKKKPL